MLRFMTVVMSMVLMSSFGLFSQTKSTYDDLVDLFHGWRKFRAPKMVEGVPDYSAKAMEQQHRELAAWQKKLRTIDTTGWTIPQQVDWHLMWAEMNGLDFKHRVKKPWSRDPAFYVWFYSYPSDVPEREAPNLYGAIEIPNYAWPLSKKDAAEITQRLGKAEEVFKQARVNLTGNARDLWVSGVEAIREQGQDLEGFAATVETAHPNLAKACLKARDASERFAQWLAEQAPSKTGTSGVGKENYTWNIKNVHLVPYSWEEVVLLMKRELARSHTALRLEENRNRHLPRLSKIDNVEEYDRRLNEAVTEYLEFFRREEIVPMKAYMDPAVRARIGAFTPPPADGLRGFFHEIIYREPIMMRTHDYHWIDLARMREEPHPSPMRQVPLLFNIFDSRAEGMATGMEEMMMHAGFLDKKPRSRELVWILLAQRAARGLGGLYQHGLEMTLDEAAHFASRWTPWGLLPADGATIQGEEHFYLRQPAYGVSYVIGKIQIEQLMAEYARQREGTFVLKEFMDAFNKAGIIPVSLIHWELTGDKSMLEAAIGG